MEHCAANRRKRALSYTERHAAWWNSNAEQDEEVARAIRKAIG
jgi:hypothetical protein